jgi:hypothetical protein
VARDARGRWARGGGRSTAAHPRKGARPLQTGRPA